jgi:hypothetical protein
VHANSKVSMTDPLCESQTQLAHSMKSGYKCRLCLLVSMGLVLFLCTYMSTIFWHQYFIE